MHPGFRYLIVFNGYPVSALAAVAFHCLVLGFILYWNTASDSSELDLVQPTVIKALFIDENPQVVERRRLERQQIQRRQEAEQNRQRELERQQEEDRRRAEEERQRQAEAERQRLAEAERQRLLDEAERQRLAEAERQRAEREQEERRQRELAEQRRREQEQAERRRQQEEEAAAAAARTEFEVVQSGVALIQQIVQENWSRPPSARNGMRAVLRVGMLPTGEVTDVVIISSSGDAAFDRSAENAVYRAQPFSELREMPINIFNENFRSLSLIFEPEDLLN